YASGAPGEEYNVGRISSQSSQEQPSGFSARRGLLVTVAKPRQLVKLVVLHDFRLSVRHGGRTASAGPGKLSSLGDYLASGGSSPTCSTATGTSPADFMSSASAALGDTSINSRVLTGPRSVTRTTTERPLFRLVTRASELSGNERCAAVAWMRSSRSPLLV